MNPSRTFCSFILAILVCSHAFAAQAESIQERVTALVNGFRNEQGRTALEAEPRLTQAAQAFADFMATTGKFEHDADGLTPRARAKQRGYEGCVIGENIAYEFSSRGFSEEALARAFVQGWKESPGHLDNIVYATFTETGIGVARARDGGYYAVQMFGEPRVSGRKCGGKPR